MRTARPRPAAPRRRTAAHWQSSFWAGLWAWGAPALCVLFACVGLDQLAENAFFVYSLGSAVTLAAGVAQYGLLSLAFGKLSKLGFRLFERVKHFRLYRNIINLQEACPLGGHSPRIGAQRRRRGKGFERACAPGLFSLRLCG